MPTITAEDPKKMETKKVDGSGKVYVDNDWAGQEVEIIITSVEDPGSEA